MDSSTRRVLQAVDEYLDFIDDRTQTPISKETETALRAASEGLRHSGDEGGGLTPGQQAVVDASGPTGERLTFDRERESMTPGERAVAEANGTI